MGLDMYLEADYYIGSMHAHNQISGHIELKGIPFASDETEPKDFPLPPLSKLSSMIYRVGYWRKANAVHRWFVENVQKGVDDCGRYEVTKKQLEELKYECELVLKDKNLCEFRLPTQSGFFFGNTNYDAWYFQDLAATVEFCNDALKMLANSSYAVTIYYQSCW